jgi:hypothetical protein
MALGSLSTSLDPSKDSEYVASSLLSYVNTTYPGRFVAQRYNLSAVTPDPATTTGLGVWQIIYDNRPNNAAQMLWAASDETSCRMNKEVKPCDAYKMLDTAVTTGINYGMRFLEIYPMDIDNPELSPIIHRAATTLGTN